jgi:branched-chain amino acid transport system substrate-binding protein
VGLIVVLVLILAAFNSQPTGNVVKDSRPVIKIGVSAPLSGGVAFIGEGMKNSFELALDEINSKDTKFKYELIYEDDAMDPKKASTIAQKFINVDKVDALITISSGPGNVVAPLAQENKILHVSSASDSNVAKGEYNFLHWTPPTEENRVLVEELQRRKITKIAIMEQNQQGVVAIVDDLKKKLDGTNIEIVSEEKFNFGETDFKTMLA